MLEIVNKRMVCMEDVPYAVVSRERETSGPDILISDTSVGNYHDNRQQSRQVSRRVLAFRMPIPGKRHEGREMVKQIMVPMGLLAIDQPNNVTSSDLLEQSS